MVELDRLEVLEEVNDPKKALEQHSRQDKEKRSKSGVVKASTKTSRELRSLTLDKQNKVA